MSCSKTRVILSKRIVQGSPLDNTLGQDFNDFIDDWLNYNEDQDIQGLSLDR